MLTDLGEYRPILKYEEQECKILNAEGEYRSCYRIIDLYINMLAPGEERREYSWFLEPFIRRYDVATVSLFNPDPLVLKNVKIATGMGSDHGRVEIIIINTSDIEFLHNIHIRGIVVGY